MGAQSPAPHRPGAAGASPPGAAGASPPSREGGNSAPRVPARPAAARLASSAPASVSARPASSTPAPAASRAAPAAPRAAPARSHGLLQWLASLFTSDDPEKEKQRQLREIAGYLKKARPRYYNPGTQAAEPALARFFYEIYRAVSSAQLLLKGAETSGALKSALIDMALGPEENALKERLSEASIDERAKKGADPTALAAEVSRDVRDLRERLDAAAAKGIDALYNRLLVLLDLVGFDYFYLLRSFDSGMPERDVAYKPHFEPVSGEHVLEALEDFLEILPCVDPDADWDRLLAILREHRGVEVVPREALRRALHVIREAQRTGILLMIVRHLEGNPSWKPMARSHHEHVVAPYLEKLRTEAELAARKVTQGKQNEKITALTQEVFGTAALTRLANYSAQANAAFTQKMLGGFTHVAPLNALRAFLQDCLDKNVREVVDILLIKGKWITTAPSQQMSEAFHQLLKVSESIASFDADLAEDGETGRRLRTIAIRVERDRRALTDMRAQLHTINGQAQALITSSLGHMVALAKVLKLAHEDCAAASPQLVANWRELRGAGKDLRGLIAGVYRKIYNFVQLMQAYR